MSRFLRFDAETLVCAGRGHCTPAAEARRVGPGDGDLVVVTGGGVRLARCLRCDAWLASPEPTAGGPETVAQAMAGIELPRRDKALRDAIVLRLIAVDRALHSVVFGLLAVVLVVLDLKLGPLKSWARHLEHRLDPALANSGQSASRDVITRNLDRVLGLHAGALKVLIATAVGYCLVEGAEAVGLWRERRWAEYLTAVATAGFLPFEVHELLKRVTVLRVGALVVNVAILVYLVWAKRLFGVRRASADDTSSSTTAAAGSTARTAPTDSPA
jgi:uncharacterized membrane protein (DUF2068 family)